MPAELQAFFGAMQLVVIRFQEPELLPYEDHSGWQGTWNEDEERLAHTPPGYWSSLVNISMIKRVLQDEMPPDIRLRFLEVLNKLVRGHLTLEAMQAVAPACNTGDEDAG